MGIPERFQRTTKPLSPEEEKALDKSAIVRSLAEALQAMQEKKLDFPLLIIPQGAEHSGSGFYVAKDNTQLEIYFEEARKDALLGDVHLVSKKDSKLESGKHPSLS